MTCKKVQGFLERHEVPIGRLIDASKEKKGQAQALQLAGKAARIVVAKGKNIVFFEMKKERPSDQTLLAHLLGPTGNLRAPTVQVGQTLYVGFNEDAYHDLMSQAAV